MSHDLDQLIRLLSIANVGPTMRVSEDTEGFHINTTVTGKVEHVVVSHSDLSCVHPDLPALISALFNDRNAYAPERLGDVIKNTLRMWSGEGLPIANTGGSLLCDISKVHLWEGQNAAAISGCWLKPRILGDNLTMAASSRATRSVPMEELEALCPGVKNRLITGSNLGLTREEMVTAFISLLPPSQQANEPLPSDITASFGV